MDEVDFNNESSTGGIGAEDQHADADIMGRKMQETSGQVTGKGGIENSFAINNEATEQDT